jgi:hypothetical protein
MWTTACWKKFSSYYWGNLQSFCQGSSTSNRIWPTSPRDCAKVWFLLFRCDYIGIESISPCKHTLNFEVDLKMRNSLISAMHCTSFYSFFFSFHFAATLTKESVCFYFVDLKKFLLWHHFSFFNLICDFVICPLSIRFFFSSHEQIIASKFLQLRNHNFLLNYFIKIS